MSVRDTSTVDLKGNATLKFFCVWEYLCVCVSICVCVCVSVCVSVCLRMCCGERLINLCVCMCAQR